MNVQKIALLADVINGTEITLPNNLLAKSIVLSNSEAIEQGDFQLAFNDSSQTLELKYIEHDDDCFDYWALQDVGELFDGRSTNIQNKFDAIVMSNALYFLVATYKHGLEKHYLVNSRDEITTCPWDTGISGFFVPSKSLVAEFEGDKQQIMDLLQGYFEEYTNYCNGEVYTVCQDSYQLSLATDIIDIDDSESWGGFIGYENTKEFLATFEYRLGQY